ncbi:KdgR transcriptional regulator, IclR family [Nocardioidaceae bacterium Broad-1]|nr:KdgR transcriptional regulator, IclR family [Nocardioidaceae bacterium Broad-1]
MDDTTEAEAKRDMVGKALLLLDRLSAYPSGVPLSTLSRETGFPLSTCHRLAGALIRDGYATFDEDSKRYSLGLKVFSLAQSVAHRRGFAGSALPALEELTEQTRETSLMSVRSDHNQLYVHHVQGPQQVSVIGTPGGLGPLHCTSMGKVLVAFAPEPERKRLVDDLDLVVKTPRTISDRAGFAAMIEQVREQGYAVADEEHEIGIRALGVPVLDPDNHAVAAVSIAAPSYRMEMDRMLELLPHLRAAAQHLAVVLPITSRRT